MNLRPLAWMTLAFSLCVACSIGSRALRAEDKPAEKLAVAKPILDGLDNPTGVAIQPGTGHLFVADSGAGRVIVVDPKQKTEARVAVGGFPADIYGKGPKYNIGPLGLAFLDKNTLVVGDGSMKDGEEVVRIYDVSKNVTLKHDAAKHTLGPIKAGEDSEKGEGNFYAVAATKTAIYITSNGDDTKGWVLRAELSSGKPGELKPFIPTKKRLEGVDHPTDAPVGITMNNSGHIVVGQMGEINVEGDSLLTVYDPEDGSLKSLAKTGLYDIAGLAYSPKSGKLYGVDYAWMAPEKGGLFELDLNEDAGTVEVKRIANLDKPTSLAITAEGTIYVTTIGTAKEGADKKPGLLLRIDGSY